VSAAGLGIERERERERQRERKRASPMVDVLSSRSRIISRHSVSLTRADVERRKKRIAAARYQRANNEREMLRASRKYVSR